MNSDDLNPGSQVADPVEGAPTEHSTPMDSHEPTSAEAHPSEATHEPASAESPTSEPAKPKKERKSKPKVEEAAPPADEPAEPAAEVAAPKPPEVDTKKRWYVVKVASGQEDSIKARLERNIKINNLEEFVSQVVIPVERVTEIKKTTKKNEDGEKVTKEKRVIKEKKKYPGYLMAEVEYNDQVLYLFRETPGVGDFVGGSLNKPPTPMTDYEVQRMLGNEVSEKDGGGKAAATAAARKVKVKIDLEKGDKVRLRDGAFAGTEGEVQEITEAKDDTDTPKITVKVQFWGRDVKIDNLEFWQVDKV
jgi:transcription termination/antitermination protein NusG